MGDSSREIDPLISSHKKMTQSKHIDATPHARNELHVYK